MRFHYHPLSSYSRKALIGIQLRGDSIELHELSPFAGDLKADAYVAMSPFGKMPVLETDDGPIYESTSIIEYLEDRGPRRLLPTGQERRARHYDRLADLYLLNPIGKWFWTKTDEVQTETVATTGKAWKIWENALADGRKFICGDDITLADLGAAVATHYADTEEVPMPDTIRRYKDRLESNPILAASTAAAAPFVEATKPRRVKQS